MLLAEPPLRWSHAAGGRHEENGSGPVRLGRVFRAAAGRDSGRAPRLSTQGTEASYTGWAVGSVLESTFTESILEETSTAGLLAQTSVDGDLPNLLAEVFETVPIM